MNDTYYELLVKRNKADIKDIALAIGTVVLIATLVALIPLLSLLSILAIGMGFVFVYFVWPRLHVEYEYVMVNADINIDIIYNKTKRKSITSFDVRKIQLLCKSSHPALNQYQNLTKLDYSSGNKDVQYAMVLNGDNRNEVIFFEPDEKLLGMISRFVPRAMVQ